MLNKKELKDISSCGNFLTCRSCSASDVDCGNQDVAQTALQLLEQLTTAKTILNDILLSGNVKGCEREIREFLEGT